MYAKLENRQMICLVQPLRIDGKDVFTNDEEVIRNYGYKPVITTNPPSQEGCCVESAWEDKGDTIMQVWTLHEAAQPEEPPIEP